MLASVGSFRGLRLPSTAMEFQLNETWCGGVKDDSGIDPEIVQIVLTRLQAYLPFKMRAFRGTSWQQKAIMPFIEISQRVVDCAWLDAAYCVLGRPAYRGPSQIDSNTKRFGWFFKKSNGWDDDDTCSLDIFDDDEVTDPVDGNYLAPHEMWRALYQSPGSFLGESDDSDVIASTGANLYGMFDGLGRSDGLTKSSGSDSVVGNPRRN